MLAYLQHFADADSDGKVSPGPVISSLDTLQGDKPLDWGDRVNVTASRWTTLILFLDNR